MSFYVFDLDGTLADCDHRLHHITGAAKDWRAFFAACGDDKPLEHTLDLLSHLMEGGHLVEIWTGRSDEAREQTLAWLAAQGITAPPSIRMRSAGDRRPDDVVKREFLADCAVRPDIIFEDRERVVEMWRREGIPCFQVAEGEF